MVLILLNTATLTLLHRHAEARAAMLGGRQAASMREPSRRGDGGSFRASGAAVGGDGEGRSGSAAGDGGGGRDAKEEARGAMRGSQSRSMVVGRVSGGGRGSEQVSGFFCPCMRCVCVCVCVLVW